MSNEDEYKFLAARFRKDKAEEVERSAEYSGKSVSDFIRESAELGICKVKLEKQFKEWGKV